MTRRKPALAFCCVFLSVVLQITGDVKADEELHTGLFGARFPTQIGEEELNRTLIVGTVEAEPYLRVIRGSHGNAYEGFIPDLMDILSKLLRFKYRFRLIDPPVYGYLDNVTSKWTGLIGEVIKSKAEPGNGVDLAAAPMSITAARQQVVDFVKPFQQLGMSVLMQRRPAADPASSSARDLMSAFQPFDASVWATTIVLMVLVWLVLWLLNLYNPYDYGCRFKLGLADKSQAEYFNVSGAFWFVYSTLQWQGYERSPRSAASKLVGCVWMSYVLIFMSTYVAGVVNSLVWLSVSRAESEANAERPPIVDLAHLVTTRIDYKVGTIADSQTFHYVADVAAGYEFEFLRNMWLTEKGNWLLVSNLTAGLQRVRREKYALIVESMVAKLVTNRRPCDLVTVGDEFGRRSYGLALPRGSPLLEHFHAAILALTEDGTLEDLERRWYTDRGECWNVTAADRRSVERARLYAADAGPKRLGPNGFCGPLVVVIVGVVLTCAIAGVEILYHRYKSKYSGTTNNAPLQGQHMRLDPDEGNM